LNVGIANGYVLPTSFVTVDRRASSASSAWWEGDIDVGRETRRYLGALDMIIVLPYLNGGICRGARP
jgi:hypothetical protein